MKKIILILAVLLAGGYSIVSAQSTQSEERTNPAAILFAGDAPEGLDVASLSAEVWKTLGREHSRLLRTSESSEKEQTLQNIIFLAKVYPDHIRYEPALLDLYYIYRFDKNEAFRIMALNALHTIGDEQMMRRLSEHVRWEKSDRIRRLTRAALVDYFNR